MRIISLKIENFGKLHNLELKFNEGLNLIVQNNGWGKSTLAGFIEAMFYGATGRATKYKEKNTKDRYNPWQGGPFAGKIVFEAYGKEYELYRNFASTSSEAAFDLRDAKTKLPSKDFDSKTIGQEIFGVSHESFVKTVFFGQNDLDTEIRDDVNSRITNIGDDHDVDSYTYAIKNLTDASKTLKSGKSGRLCARRDEITRLEIKENLGDKLTGELLDYNDEIKRLEKQLEKIDKELGSLTHELEQKMDYGSNSRKEIRLLEEINEKRDEMRECTVSRAESLGLKILQILDFIGVLLIIFFMFTPDKKILIITLIITLIIFIVTVFAFTDGKEKKKLYKERKAEYEELLENLKAVRKERNAYSNGGDKPSLTELTDKKTELVKTISYKKREEEKLRNGLDEWQEDMRFLEELRIAQAAEEKQYELLEKAKEKLEIAKNNINVRYGNPVKNNFRTYVNMFDETCNYSLDVNSNILLEAMGGQRGFRFLSIGNQDMLNLCLRMAIIDAMYQKERPVMVLDDPFINLDDERMVKAMEFINRLSERYQIIYLTCSTNRT